VGVVFQQVLPLLTKSFTDSLAGLGAHLWKNEIEELKKEREREWDL
jgi:hypothetical protein